MIRELNYFLKLQIKQLKERALLNQSKYVKDLLKRFEMNYAKEQPTLIRISIKLNVDEGRKNIDIKAYRRMIGVLLYLIVSRPNIMFSVCMCVRFQVNPKESHLNAIKMILRYLNST